MQAKIAGVAIEEFLGLNQRCISQHKKDERFNQNCCCNNQS